VTFALKLVKLAYSMTTGRATPPMLKSLNERTVLDAIRSYAPVSRAEISRRVGISKPTVSLALQSLLDAGLVREGSHDGDGPSYGAVYFEPVPEAAFVLGLDLGARFVRGALCDLLGEVRARARPSRRSPAPCWTAPACPTCWSTASWSACPARSKARRHASRSPRT
jgi:DNA-binding transcriptional ArsR family regulator